MILTNNKRFQVLTLIILLAGAPFILAQESVSVEPNNSLPKFYIGLSGGPCLTQEIIDPSGVLTGLLVTDKNKFSVSADLGYYFSRNLGLITGIEYSLFSSELSLSNYDNSFNTTDADNETFEKRITGSGITEIQNITFLKVPVKLSLRMLPGSRIGLFLNGGINVVLPINSTYEASGTFSYSGYYPAYNVTFSNLPAYGFDSNASVNTKSSMKLQQPFFEGHADAGITCKISGKLQLALSAYYSRSLISISGYKSPDTFQLSSDKNSMSSLIGGSGNVTAQVIGAKVGIRYFFR
jgi:hypothetical protein